MSADKANEITRLLNAVESDDSDIEVLNAEERRLAAAHRAGAELFGRRAGGIRGTYATSEQMTYSQAPGGPSYFADMAYVAQRGFNPESDGAARRLHQHGREIEVESRHNPDLIDMLADSRFESRINPNTTAGTGGEFVPPLWLVANYVPYVRAGWRVRQPRDQRPVATGH